MANERQEFAMEYPCHSPSKQRWFHGKATRFRGDGPLRVVVAHEDITERKHIEEHLAHYREHLEELVKMRTAELDAKNAQLLAEVVERKRAERSAVESGERLRVLVDMAPDIICRIKEDRTIDFISSAIRQMGYEPDELTGRPFMDIVHPEDRRRIDAVLVEKRIGARRAKNQEFRLLKNSKGGNDAAPEVFFVEVSLRGVWDVPDSEIVSHGKRFRYSLGIVRDVTVRKKSEKALRESEKGLTLLKDVASAANAAVTNEDALRVAVEGIARYLTWPVGHVYVVDEQNPSVLMPTDIWYLEEAEKYRPFVEITQKTVLAPGRGMIGQVLERREVLWFEDVTVNPSFLRKRLTDDIRVRGAFGFPIKIGGKVTAVLEFFSPNREEQDPVLMKLMDEIGAQLGIVFERKRAEDELKKLYRAVEQSRATVVITDVNGKIQYVNPKFTILTGYSYEEAIGKDPSIMNSGQQPRQFYEDLWATIVSGKEWYGQFCNKKKNGDVYWESASISPVRNEKGKITHFVAVKEDITQLLQYEEDLKKAKEIAEKANRAKSDFLAGMSHELRTPLNAVIGFSEVLQERYFGPLTDKQEEYVKDILESGRHLLALINDILDLTKVEAGKMDLELSDFSVSDLIHNSIVMIREKAAKHRITIQIDMAPDVEKIEIRADERKIKQVLFNLISNAVKFTPDGGAIHLLADFVLEPAPAKNGASSLRFLQISVQDDGIGLSAENQVKIFDHFYQVSSDRRDKTPGTGLGLPLSGELIELHGGSLWAESDGEGKGSRFIFRIPVDRA
jgi:PAS domain S-box-containing protein